VIALSALFLDFLPERLAFRPLRDPASARELLSVTWQVVATVYGLSLAVMLLALEVFAAGAQSVLHRAREVGMFWYVNLGAVLLLVNGLALLGVGRGAPGVPAAAVVLALAGLQLILLPVMLARMARAIDPEHQRRVRSAALVQAVHEAVDRRAYEAIAFALLDHYCTRAGARLDHLLASVPAGWTPVKSSRSGHVRDIRVWRLQRAARMVPGDSSAGKLVVCVRLGQSIAAGQVLVALPSGAPTKALILVRGLVIVR
jgi:hypothetical protein